MTALRVLVVDDHDETRLGVGSELTKNGFEVDYACNTEEACDALDAKEYDLVISDIVMPGEINGIEFGKILKESQTNVVAIAMSASDAVQASADAGFSYFLCKPFSVKDLMDTINAALNRTIN